MEYCCRLGEKYHKKDEVLFESDNFFVAPALGQMGIEGYLLICSKKHFDGFGDIPSSLYSEFESILKKTKETITNNYNSKVLVFEHGPKLGCHKGGGCLDHAHVHLVPTNVDIMQFINNKFQTENIKDFSKLKDIYESNNSSYMFIEDQNEKRFLINVKLPIASQYLRQVIAAEMNISEWDWREYPDKETFEKTYDKLKNKF